MNDDTMVKAPRMREAKQRALDLAAILVEHGANGLNRKPEFEK